MSGLGKQVIPVSFGGGLSTKDDPKQLVPGRFTTLQNAIFKVGKSIKKRFGFAQLPSLSAGVGIASYASELVSLDGSNLYSLNESGSAQTLKGALPLTTLSTTNVIRTTTQQASQDSAINGSLRAFVWTDSVGQLGYSIFDSATNQSIVNNQTLSVTGTVSKVFALGTNFVFVYFDGALLRYKSVSLAAPTSLSAAVTIASDISVAVPVFDCTLNNGSLYVAYNGSTAKLSLYSLSSTLALSAQKNFGSDNAASITIFKDASFNVWVSYSITGSAGVNSTINYFILDQTLATTVLGKTQLDAFQVSGVGRLIQNITGIVAGAVGTVYYEVFIPDPNANVTYKSPGNFIKQNTGTLTGTIGSPAVFNRGLGLASKVFVYNSIYYLWTASQSPLQSSYFLIDQNDVVVAKLSPSLGGGFTTQSILPEVNTVSTGVFHAASLIKDLVTVTTGNITTQTGVLSATVTFPSKDPSKFTLGENLHVAGGVLTMYDGSSVVEHGFNLYPEDISLASIGNTGGIGSGASTADINQFQYSATYEWTDNQGQLHRSAPSIPLTLPLPKFLATEVTATFASGNQTLTGITDTTGIYVGMYLSIATANASPPFLIASWTYNTIITGVTPTTVTVTNAPTSSGTVRFLATSVPVTMIYAPVLIGSTLPGSFQSGSALIKGQTVMPLFENQNVLAANTTVVNPTTGQINNPALTTSVFPHLFFTKDTYRTVIGVPSLKVTSKKNVTIILYRTENNGTVFYRVSSFSAPTLNDKTVDRVTVGDATPDATLVGNEQLYTTGNEVENIAAPAVSVATTFKSRGVFVPSETPLSWWYSKQVLPGSPVEFSDLFVNNVDARIGKITALGVLDEKIIFFGPTSKYFVVGDGPAPSGANNDFSQAQHITGSTGCSNQASVLEIPIGLIYQDPSKGIYLLDRSLQENYIGKEVEQFNARTVTSSQTVPGSTSVRFTLDDGTVLIYDWFEGQWGADPFPAAVSSSTIFQNQFTYIQANGAILKQDPTLFTDNAAFIPMNATTGWISFAGVEGFQRVKRLLILGNYKSPHTLTINIFSDFNEAAPTQTITIPVLSDPGVYQYRIHILQQKCESIKIQILESQSTPYGEGYSLSTMAFEVGVKEGPMKLSAGKSF